MNTAANIVQTLNSIGATAVTLYGGYACLTNGETFRFEPGAMSQVRHNERGRCTHAVAKFTDGSAIKFTYSDNRGSSFRVL